MANSSETSRRGRSGTISVVTLIAILALMMLIGFVGNAGQATNHKIESQNAADAAAIASAQWMARSMNAITATNHLLGEVTAIVTIHEALGGPEVDVGIEASTPESDLLNTAIENLATFAPIRSPFYVPQPLTTADEEFLSAISGQVANSEHRAFATIYDSRMTLKKKLVEALFKKLVANFGFFVPPPWGYASAAVAYATHGWATTEIAGIAKEWLVLQALEIMAIHTKDLKSEMLEGQLIPALAEHARLAASVDDSSSGISLLSGGGLVGNSIQRSLDRFQQRVPVALSTFPRATAVKLPVQREPAPSLRPGANLPQWNGGDDDNSLGIDLQKTLRQQQKRKKRLRDRINDFNDQIETLDDQEDEVRNALGNASPGSQEATDLREELDEIRDLRASKRTRLEEARLGYAEFVKNEQNLIAALGTYNPQESGNLSDRVDHLALHYLNQQEERFTQWVRATYPYVDALRAPIIAQFDQHLNRSEARKHFVKWTDRYTLVKSWQFRSGYRFAKTGPGSGSWSKTAEPLHMYVMKQMYDHNGIQRKGDEPWTKSTIRGKQSAEELFTMIALGHRDFTPLYAPKAYQTAPKNGLTTYAQAVIYNANPQMPLANQFPGGNVQPKVGWDTLNWDPDADPPEWGADPSVGQAKWPWEILSAARESNSVKVRLNWQAKLMPVTQTRLAQAAADNSSTPMGKMLKLSVVNFKDMNSH